MIKYLALLASIQAFGTSIVVGGVNQQSITDISELSYDQNDRLTKNYLFYASSSPCAKDMRDFPLREAVAVSDDIMSKILKHAIQPNTCPIACMERGYHKDFVTDPLPDSIGYDVADIDVFVTQHCQKVEMAYHNYHPNEINVYWIDPRNQRRIPQGKLGIDRDGRQSTYLSHRFEFRDADTNELVRDVTVTHEMAINIGQIPPNSALAGVEEYIDRLNETARETFDMEWRRSQKIKRTFSEFGFQKSKLPRDVWGSMTAYYYNNDVESVPEDWSGKGIYVNWWEQNAVLTRMTDRLKSIWAARLQWLIEEWIGQPVEPTSLYGMRKYQEGARLLTHVDREKTHAASLIINIAQGNIREPWKIEVYDLANRLHEVEMEPGDIVYYESARCLHGRTKALNGSYYVNLFSHYRPVGGNDEWYLEPNPPNAPKPAIDLGECSVVDGKVHCNGAYDVSATMSPIMQQLHGPQDLFNYWVELGGAKRPERTPSYQPLEQSFHAEL